MRTSKGSFNSAALAGLSHGLVIGVAEINRSIRRADQARRPVKLRCCRRTLVAGKPLHAGAGKVFDLCRLRPRRSENETKKGKRNVQSRCPPVARASRPCRKPSKSEIAELIALFRSVIPSTAETAVPPASFETEQEPPRNQTVMFR